MIHASTTREEIQRQIDSLPDEKLPAVKDILELIGGDLLTAGSLEVWECPLMSSSALGKELNTPEEDEAWREFNEGMWFCSVRLHRC
jgi:hypothetical protein